MFLRYNSSFASFFPTNVLRMKYICLDIDMYSIQLQHFEQYANIQEAVEAAKCLQSGIVLCLIIDLSLHIFQI